MTRGALYKKLRFVNVRNVGTNLRGWYVSWCNFPAKPEIRTHVSYVSKQNFLYNAPQLYKKQILPNMLHLHPLVSNQYTIMRDLSLKCNSFAISYKGCCKEFEIIGKGTPKNSLESRGVNIFTTYKLEPDLVNGKQHYTSQDGTRAISFVNNRIWMVQSASAR